MKKIISFLISVFTFLFFVSSAQSLTIDPTLYDGLQSADFGFGQIKAGDKDDSFLDKKSLNGFTATGVTSRDGSDFVAGEIDGTEYIDFNFDGSYQITDFTIAFLFADGNFGDNVDEQADVKIWDGTQDYHFYLTATDPGVTNYTWTGAGTVTVISEPDESNAGVFKISNPFTKNVTSLKFLAGDPSGGGAFEGDYAIGNINAVPEPTTMLLFGTGLFSLAAFGRKRFMKKG